MKSTNWLFLTIAIMLLSFSPVPSFYLVVDNNLELANLTGVWEGEFTTSIPDRYGSLYITMTATHDTAYGEVALSWQTSFLSNIMWEDPNALDSYRNTTQVLKIKEIFFKNGNIAE